MGGVTAFADDAQTLEFCSSSGGLSAEGDIIQRKTTLNTGTISVVDARTSSVLQVRRIADRYARGTIVSTLAGGYEVSAFDRSVIAHVQALLELAEYSAA